MANSISRAAKYLPVLDEVFQDATCLGDLGENGVEFTGVDTVKIYKTSMDGLADYDRQNGFIGGDVTGTWETETLSVDRGRSFTIDGVDNEEAVGMPLVSLASEFIRTKVVPEMDAYKFATMAGTSNILTTSGADITPGTTDVPALIDAATEAMDDAEVPKEGRILYISNKAYNGLKNKIVRMVVNTDNGVNKTIEVYDEMKVVRVPKGRFYTAITRKTGKTGQTEGGYTKASGAKAINFMIVHPSAIHNIDKHVANRLFTPDENQQADGWKFDYRIVGDLFVEENKVTGIYLHKSSTDAS